MGFADGITKVCGSEYLGLLELYVYEALYRSKKGLDSRNLEVAVDKTIAILVTQLRGFKLTNIHIMYSSCGNSSTYSC